MSTIFQTWSVDSNSTLMRSTKVYLFCVCSFVKRCAICWATMHGVASMSCSSSAQLVSTRHLWRRSRCLTSVACWRALWPTTATRWRRTLWRCCASASARCSHSCGTRSLGSPTMALLLVRSGGTNALLNGRLQRQRKKHAIRIKNELFQTALWVAYEEKQFGNVHAAAKFAA